MAQLGIDHVKSLFDNITGIMCDAIGIVKGGIGFGALPKALHLLSEVKDLVSNAPGAIPELADLDGAESAELGNLAYNSVYKILEAVKA